LPVELAAVLSDQPEARLLDLGLRHGARTECIVPTTPRGRLDAETEGKFVQILRAEKVELVVLAGFMRIVGPVFLGIVAIALASRESAVGGAMVHVDEGSKRRGDDNRRRRPTTNDDR
jgi:hypothetical protein